MGDHDRVTAKSRYHHGDLRAQLTEATRQLVEEKGPDGFSVSEACRLAGVSTAAPYRHFTDREDMLVAVAIQGMEQMTAGFHDVLQGKEPGSIEAISAIGVSYIRFAEAHPGVFRMMFADKLHTPELEERGHSCHGVVVDQVRAYMGVDEVDEEVVRSAFPLWTFVHGASFLRIDGKATFAGPHRSVEELVTLATERLLPSR